MKVSVFMALTVNSRRIDILLWRPSVSRDRARTKHKNKITIKIKWKWYKYKNTGFVHADRKQPPYLYPALEVGGVRGPNPDGGLVANVTPQLPGFNAPCRSPGRNEKKRQHLQQKQHSNECRKAQWRDWPQASGSIYTHISIYIYIYTDIDIDI